VVQFDFVLTRDVFWRLVLRVLRVNPYSALGDVLALAIRHASIRKNIKPEVAEPDDLRVTCAAIRSKVCAGLLRKASSRILISLIHVFIEIQARRFGEPQAAASKH
jgi:hypothetical protein